MSQPPLKPLKVNVDQVDGKVVLSFNKKELVELTPDEASKVSSEEALMNIAKVAARCCHRLRFNNKLWANACMKDLEDLLEQQGLYEPPKDQG